EGTHEGADAEPGGQKQQRNERNEGRHHEHVAMGEIHHADDAEHHRVADGNETVDRTERDAVDELLGEDFHARAPDAEASSTIRQPVKLYHGAARPATAPALLRRAVWAEEAWGGERARNQGSACALSDRSPDGGWEWDVTCCYGFLACRSRFCCRSGRSAGFIKPSVRRLAGPMG